MQVIVVGGGAAGFFAALRAAELHPDWRVTILESAAKPLGKVRISGGGRCNVTHDCPELSRLVTHYPRGGKQLRPVLARFGCPDTRRWFEERGVPLKVEADGRVFPVSDNSQTIIDCLTNEARRLKVEVVTRTPVSHLEQGFTVEGRPADRVILACGSSPAGYRMAQKMGHSLIPPVPSLFTFSIADERLDGLQGISLPKVKATLGDITQEGPLLITHWGLSGPAVLKLSAWGARELADRSYQADLRVDMLPEMKDEELRQRLLGGKTSNKQIGAVSPIPFPKRLWERWVACAGIDPKKPYSEVPDKALNKLTEAIKRAPFVIQGKGVFKEEFVTAGGVPLNEVDLDTMQSRKCPGLYLAGEILDVDGVTGGFNFQSAWATGWVAGSSVD